MSEITQIFIKFLDNKTLTLQFPPKFPITPQSITHHLQSKFQLELQTLTLILNGKLVSQSPLTKIPNYSTLTLTTQLRGGKGGFGSLLRGAATKAGQKKTNNFDACRDMSGRRLRHVNAEKKMEEWKAGEEERNLEKKAEKYLKDMVKKGKGGKRDDGAEKYVQEYREKSAKCVEDVEKSVREAALGGLKRKGGVISGGDSKKLNIWMGKRKMGDSDSDDSDGDTESDASDAENEKSAVTDNNGSHSDSSKDASYGPVPVPQLAEDQNGKESSDSGSGEENETPIKVTLDIDATPSSSDGHVERSSDGENKMPGKAVVSADVEAVPAQIVSDLPSSSDLMEIGGTQSAATDEVREDSECKTAFAEEALDGISDVQEATPPLNFDEFSSASELEVLGLDRLKSELQARGLKCGGTLQERASRLFLLKTTPLDKIPKKLLAKK